MNDSKDNKAAAEPPLDCLVRRCGECRFAGQWISMPTVRKGQAIGTTIRAECMFEPLPEFWAERGDRPMILPHSGSHCRLFEQKAVPNVEVTGAEPALSAERPR